MTSTVTTRFKCGDVREDGYVFDRYRKDGKQKWSSPSAFHNCRLHIALHGAKRRADERGIPFELDIEHLHEIYPEDGRCPALGVPLKWCGGRDDSPSLDRIRPDLGYVRGNVQWLSDKANNIKAHATTAEICAVAEFLRKNDY